MYSLESMNWTGLNLSLEFCHFRSVASYVTGLSKALTMHLAPWDTFIISHLIPELQRHFVSFRKSTLHPKFLHLQREKDLISCLGKLREFSVGKLRLLGLSQGVCTA